MPACVDFTRTHVPVYFPCAYSTVARGVCKFKSNSAEAIDLTARLWAETSADGVRYLLSVPIGGGVDIQKSLAKQGLYAFMKKDPSFDPVWGSTAVAGLPLWGYSAGVFSFLYWTP